MRTWGRVYQNQYSSAIGSFTIGLSGVGGPGYSPDYQWVEVTTDSKGYNDAVWLTTLAQVLQLGLNESPMFGNYGIPAQQSAANGVFPDYYVGITQQNFSKYFLSLLVSRAQAADPTYNINATANPGASLMSPVPV
jgi:hypothetical protein